MADPKSELKAELAEVEHRSGSRVAVGLSFVAGGLAVALLVACIGGGLYIGDLQKTIEEQKYMIDEDQPDTSNGNTYHITYESSELKEEDEITVDPTRDTEMFTRKDEDGDISSVAIADFKRGIYVMYIPKQEECYIASGVDSWMANTSASIKEYEQHNGETVHLDDNDNPTVNFVKASETAVSDHSILPYDIRPFCKGKPLYWIHETNEKPGTEVSEEGSGPIRNKRACTYKSCSWSFGCSKWKCTFTKTCIESSC